MLSFLTQSTPTGAPSAGAAAAAASAMFDDEFFARGTRAAFPPLTHHGATPHFPFGGFPVHHDPFGSEFCFVYDYMLFVRTLLELGRQAYTPVCTGDQDCFQSNLLFFGLNTSGRVAHV